MCSFVHVEIAGTCTGLNVVGEYPHKLYILKEAEEQFKCLGLQHGITNKESVEGQTDRGGCCTNTNNEGINLHN